MRTINQNVIKFQKIQLTLWIVKILIIMVAAVIVYKGLFK